MTTSLSVFFGKDKDKAFFFSGDRYIRYDKPADRADDGYPNPIQAGWRGLPFDRIDAAFNRGDGKAFFFSGNQYARYDLKKDRADDGYPAPIRGNWSGLTFDSVDAAVNWGNGKVFFFKGGQYTRYDIKSDRADEGYPAPIRGNWPGLPFDSVDAVINWGNGVAYFFKGDRYIRYLVKEDRADGGARPVDAVTWPGLAWGRQQYDWMGSIPGVDDLKLFELTLPATHDSGAYNLTSDVAPVNDLPSWIVEVKRAADSVKNLTGVDLFGTKAIISEFIVSLNQDLSRTQSRGVGEQLAYGVRSLDLRVCSFRGELHVYHGLVGARIREVLAEVRQFLQTARREVVFLRASHMSNLGPREHEQFLALIKETLGEHLYASGRQKALGETTVGEIVRAGSGPASRVIFLYDLSGVSPKPALPLWVWPYEGIYSDYANESDLAKMRADQQWKLDRNAGTPQQLFELNWTLTPQSDDAQNEAVGRLKDLLGAVAGLPGLLADEIIEKFAKKLSGGGGGRPSWHSLEQLSRQANASLRDFVAANEGKQINFLSVDFFQNARAVELAVDLCRQRSAAAAVAGVS